MVEEAGGYYRFHFDATLYKIFVNLTFFRCFVMVLSHEILLLHRHYLAPSFTLGY